MLTQKLYRNGNSVAVTIPKDYLETMKLKDGSEVTVEQDLENESIIISPKKNIGKLKSTVTPKFIKWLEEFNQEYGPALRELAKK